MSTGTYGGQIVLLLPPHNIQTDDNWIRFCYQAINLVLPGCRPFVIQLITSRHIILPPFPLYLLKSFFVFLPSLYFGVPIQCQSRDYGTLWCVPNPNPAAFSLSDLLLVTFWLVILQRSVLLIVFNNWILRTNFIRLFMMVLSFH